MRHSIEKIKKKLVCLLAVVFTVHHLSGYGFAEEAVSAETEAAQNREGQTVVIPESDHIYVNGSSKILTANGEISALLRLTVESPGIVHIISSGVNITLVLYDEAADEVCGVYTSEDGLLDVPFDAAAGTYLLGFSGWGEVKVLAADEENAARINEEEEVKARDSRKSEDDMTDDSEKEDTEKTLDDSSGDETAGESSKAPETGTTGDTAETATEETSGEPLETPGEETRGESEEKSPEESSGKAGDELTEESGSDSAEAPETETTGDTAETATQETTGESAETATEETTGESAGAEAEETTGEPAKASAEETESEPVETVSDLTIDETAETPNEENTGDEQAPAETAGVSDENITEGTDTVSVYPQIVESADTSGDNMEGSSGNEPEEIPAEETAEQTEKPGESEKGFFAGFAEWLIGKPSDESTYPDTDVLSGESPEENKDDLAEDEAGNTNEEPAGETTQKDADETDNGEAETSDDETDDELTGEGADGEISSGDAETTSEDLPGEDLPEEEQQEEPEEEPFDASVPIGYQAKMNETVSVLTILADAGAPANYITAVAGETEGAMVSVFQNGDWLLTPYTYFDSIELLVKAGDSTAADFAASETIYTLIFTNPAPVQENETETAAASTDAEDVEPASEEADGEIAEMPDDEADGEIAEASDDETGDELTGEGADGELSSGDAETTDEDLPDEDLPDEDLPGDDLLSDDLPEEEQQEEPEEEPFDASVPIGYQAKMNETVSVLAILADAGAPANYITAVAGETEGAMVSVFQNGDWLLTPYTYFDSIELLVKAGDFTSADFSASEAIYTLIFSNPAPVQENETETAAASADAEDVEPASEETDGETAEMPAEETDGEKAETSADETGEETADETADGQAYSGDTETTSEDLPEEDLPEEEQAEPEEKPFDASVPIGYQAAMNETISVLAILADAGAPANVITGLSGEMEGLVFSVSQNGDWLLTPYAYFENMELSVTATDYLAENPSGAEAVYTVVLSNPDPDAEKKPEEPEAVSEEEEAEGAEDALPEKDVTIEMERFEGNEIRLFAKNTDAEENENLVYQWQFSLDNEHWVDVEGANAREYTFTLDDTTSNSYWRLCVSQKASEEEAKGTSEEAAFEDIVDLQPLES